MILRYALLVLGLLMSFSLNAAIAQADDGKKAKALYFAAEDAYAAKKYDEALIGIEVVESLLGKSNALLQGLRVKALYGKGDLAGTKKALDAFFQMEASDALSREIAPYLLNVKKKIEERETKSKRDAEKSAAHKKAGFLDLTYGPTAGNSIIAPPDGGFVIVGYTPSKNPKIDNARVLRLDRRGGLLWDKSFESGGALSIAALPDGGFIVAGFTRSKGAGESDAWILRLDGHGQLLWDKTYGGEQRDAALSVATLPDNGFALAGYKYSKDSKSWDAWIFRLDRQGKLLWEKTFGGKGTEKANAIVAMPDGGFLIAGDDGTQKATNENGWQDVKKSDAWLLRLDGRGRLLSEQSFGGKEFDSAKSIAALPGGGFVVAGSTQTGVAGNTDAWVLRLDGQGKLLWEKSFGGKAYDTAESIVALPDGGFVVAGITNSEDPDNYDAYVLRLDRDGRLLWEDFLGGEGYGSANSLVALPDGKVAVAGKKGRQTWLYTLQPSKASVARQ